jgi:transposase
MLYAQDLTETEHEVLLGHYRKTKNQLIKERAHVILISHQGKTVVEIAAMFFRTKKTIRQWLNSFNTTRIASIFHAYDKNENAAKLTRAQKDEIAEVLKRPDGLSTEFLSVPKLQEYIDARFGVVYESEQSYHYLLKYCGFSWKLPSSFDRRRNEQKIEIRMREIRKEIKPFLEDEDWVVLAADEARIDYEEEIRRLWLPKGEKTVLKIERDKSQKQHYFGALNLKNKRHHLLRLDWQDSENIIRALGQLKAAYPKKRICLLWDNAKWHKSKALREKLAQGELLSPFHLINFPPYAPDKNPQEHVWRYGKDEIRGFHFDTFNSLRNQFESAISSRSFGYKL